MVEYSFEEATVLLSNNLEAADKNLKSLEEDIGFLKDQITTTEVSILLPSPHSSSCMEYLLYIYIV